MFKAEHNSPNIPGVELRVASAALRRLIQWHCVMEQHDRARSAILFDVDEVSQGLLVKMETVNEGHIEISASEYAVDRATGEELITWFRKNMGLG